MDDLDDTNCTGLYVGGLRSQFDRSLAFLLQDLAWMSTYSKRKNPDIEVWLGIDRYDISLDEFKAKCKRGLLPREILFCYGEYDPNPKRDSEYDWLRVVKGGAGFIESKEGLKTKINRKNLDQHLRKLLRIQVITKKDGRYLIGPSAYSQPGKFYQIKEALKNAKVEESWSKGPITLVGLNTKDRTFAQTNKEMMQFLSERLVEPASEVWKRYLQHGEFETVWYKDGIPELIDVTRRKKGLYDRLPLIVIDPNGFVSIGEEFREAVKNVRESGPYDD